MLYTTTTTMVFDEARETLKQRTLSDFIKLRTPDILFYPRQWQESVAGSDLSAKSWADSRSDLARRISYDAEPVPAQLRLRESSHRPAAQSVSGTDPALQRKPLYRLTGLSYVVELSAICNF